jgi:chromosome segregation ATPase
MATNGREIAAEIGATLDRPPVRRRAAEHWTQDEYVRQPAVDPMETAAGFALAPLVDKIAYTIARGLVVAVKELEDHIAAETRKVGDSVDKRMDTLQATLAELTKFAGEQQTTNAAVDGTLQELNSGLRETENKRVADVETLRKEARESASAVSQRIEGVCRELGVHQEDIAALKSTLTVFSSRVDGLVERLDRQAETVRSMCSAYSQRETELEQLVDGLARLRAFPTPVPSTGI